MMHPSDIPWWKTHSADYVLGLLSNSERLVFERIMPIEPELQAFVVDWRETLQPMSDALPPIKPPDHILPALISNIPVTTNSDGRSASDVRTTNNTAMHDDSMVTGAASAATDLVVAPAIPGSLNRNAYSDHRSDSEYLDESTVEPKDLARLPIDVELDGELEDRELGDRVLDTQNKTDLNIHASASELTDGNAFMRMLERKQKSIDAWRSFAGLATAAGLLVAVLGWMGIQQAQDDQAEPTFDGISVVQSSNEKALWVVDSSADEKKLRVTAVSPPALKEGKAFELWMVRPGDGGVVSMGLLPSKANTSANFNAHRFSAEAVSFGVSVESDKGSPESIPKGPVLYQGSIQRLSY